MKVNRKLLPIKSHFFFFMASMGPILPQLPVFGKELGISSVVMGTITGTLPFAFLVAKPAFGLLVDVHRNRRKTIFMALIAVMAVSFALINLIPARRLLKFTYADVDAVRADACNYTDILDEQKCDDHTVKVMCASKCVKPMEFLAQTQDINSTAISRLCRLSNTTIAENCTNALNCIQDIESDNTCLYETLTFWGFVVLMAIGTIGFNVINSISDAICFDVIGEEYDYGKQRVWGTIGFGLTALLSGYIVNHVSGFTYSYTPAFIIMFVCCLLDLISCIKLKLPVIEAPKNICKDLKELLNNRHVITFITFAVFAGIVDSMLIYFLFWYLEDLAVETNTKNIKLLEGMIVAAETLGGEVIFFSVSGKILERFGHVRSFSMCFLMYALRLGLVSVAPSPWWVLPVELLLQGPTYALAYTTVVAYANELAPPGTSATMQGIAAGMDDGVGYAVGSILGGVLYRYIGGRHALQVYSAFALFCSVTHLFLHRFFLGSHKPTEDTNQNHDYKNPEDAIKATYDIKT